MLNRIPLLLASSVVRDLRHCHEIFVSGLRMLELLRVRGEQVTAAAKLPPGTHNAQWFEGGLLYNDTASNRVCYQHAERMLAMSVRRYESNEIHNPERLEPSVARPGFARGLCPVAPGYAAGGSSPSTISIYHLPSGTRTLSRNLSMDVRNAIHGLAAWPYSQVRVRGFFKICLRSAGARLC